MAYVYKRPDSKRWTMAWIDETGQLKRKVSKVRYKQEAEARARELEENAELVRLGLKTKSKSQTWDAVCDRWEKDVLPNLRANVNRASEMRLHLRPAFKGRALNSITAGDIDSWLTGLRTQGLGDSTRSLMRSRLHGVFSLAVRLEWLSSNPVSRAKRVKVPQKLPRFLTQDEVRLVIKVAPEWFRPILATALFMGLRRGELAGLKWEDVDLDNRIMLVRRSYNETTKGGREFSLPIPEALVPFLKSAWATRTSDWCFPSQRGLPRTKAWKASESFNRVLKAAGITRKIVFHDTRHTWATHSYAATLDLRLTQRLARHSNMKTTELYAHLLDQGLHEKVSRLTYGSAGTVTSEQGSLHETRTSARLLLSEGNERPVKSTK